MRICKQLIIILIIASISIFRVTGKDAKKLVLDLSKVPPNGTMYKYGNNSFDSIEIMNAFPFEFYSIEMKKVSTLLPPLSKPIDYNQGKLKNSPDSCFALREVHNKLKELKDKNMVLSNAYTEDTIAMRINSLRNELKVPTCSDISLKTESEKLIGEFSRPPVEQEITIGFGEVVTVTVKQGEKVWTWVFTGDEIGKWVTTYGFGFTSAALEGATYFTEQVPDTNQFQVVRADKPDPLDLYYIPAVFFSFFPSQRFNDCWNHSLTAGLGFDYSAPVVFLGYNGMFYHNIGISIGVAMQEQNRLKSQYHEDEIINSSLDEDQLHDEIYRPNLYFAIHFRFGENPFKNETGD